MDRIATAIEDNLCAYAAFFGATSLAELNDQPSLLWVISRIPTLPFTGILRPYPLAPNQASTITTTMTYFQQHQARPSWIFNPTRTTPTFVAHLHEYHLTETANLPALALDLAFLRAEVHHPLPMTLVTDSILLATWAQIYAECNGAPEWIRDELFRLFNATAYQSGQPLRLYLGWQANQPIATAATFRYGDTVGLYEVATLPAFRQQGIASTLTTQVLLEAYKEGYQLATLLASEMAEQLYRKLGFTEYCRVVIYN